MAKKKRKNSNYRYGMKEEAVKKPQRETGRIVLAIVFGFIFLLASVFFSVAIWYANTFDISFSDLLFTMLSPLGGTGESTMAHIFGSCLPPVLALMAVYVGLVLLLWKQTRVRMIMRKIGACLCVVALLLSIVFSLYAYRIPEYIKNMTDVSELYEKEYVDPSLVNITDKDGNARNLIYIYLESMETTYASIEDGGNQPKNNYMPNLTALAHENISFSDCEALGGFRSITGTGWTMGALMGTTSGVPFSLAVFGENSQNSQGKDGTFVNGLTALGDILEEKGYAQEFLCGSNVNFGGRGAYFTVHGNYEIFDLYTAIDEGYVSEKNDWWGFDDKMLFTIAKDEITELASGDKPFNFTMLTVDPHHNQGYICELCGDEYSSRTANVIKCQDNQVKQFIDWCKSQDFFENTTIIITGDHPRMDKPLIGDLDIYDRPIYNCIINSVATPYSDTTNRTFTSLDMFPTTLAAMGFEIEGERLGLGTNLFSPVPTLCEKNGGGKTGYDWLDSEVSKASDYYKENFVNGGKD